MTLVDTSVWIDHLRDADSTLQGLLDAEKVLCHPLVIGELALGNLKPRHSILKSLHHLPNIMTATDSEELRFIEQHRLFGIGIGYIDMHLLASVQLTPDARLWTHDKRLHEAAERLNLGIKPSLRDTVH